MNRFCKYIIVLVYLVKNLTQFFLANHSSNDLFSQTKQAYLHLDNYLKEYIGHLERLLFV